MTAPAPSGSGLGEVPAEATADEVTRSEPDGHRLECDLVMKGGITSGVAYPAAIAELHETYGFRMIGGASAGAIAAAATAAAEHGHADDVNTFARLRELSEQLTEPGALEGLFAPTKAAKPAFLLLLRLQRDSVTGGGPSERSRAAKVAAAVATLTRALWPYPVIAAVLSLFALSALINQFHPTGRPAVLGMLILLVLTLIGAGLGLIIGVLTQVWKLVVRVLPDSFFGICTGMPTDPDDPAPTTALTPWLHSKLQDLAGEGEPLTFHHLATGGNTCGNPDGITLTMMTTDVSRARPVQLPAGITDYCFCPDDMRRLFPEDVVAAMCAASDIVDHTGAPDELRRLKSAEDLPVIVATRMSLSFPVLLSAVPLYTVPTPGGEARRHWLSDGGISSNFPIHLFDSWLPRRPTLALSFGRTTNPGVDPCSNEAPTPPHTATGSLSGFLRQILDTMQNWRDTVQSELPGFNDRVEPITLGDGEGGMNLTMSEESIASLIDKGQAAGANLATFPERWESHRLHRYQMTMRLLQEELGPQSSFRTPSADELLDGLSAGSWPDNCRCTENEGWGAAASNQTRQLAELVARWAPDTEGGTVSFADGEPKLPLSVLRRTPKV